MLCLSYSVLYQIFSGLRWARGLRALSDEACDLMRRFKKFLQLAPKRTEPVRLLKRLQRSGLHRVIGERSAGARRHMHIVPGFYRRPICWLSCVGGEPRQRLIRRRRHWRCKGWLCLLHIHIEVVWALNLWPFRWLHRLSILLVAQRRMRWQCSWSQCAGWCRRRSGPQVEIAQRLGHDARIGVPLLAI